MSGSIAAIAAYNGSGTQGYRTTDKYAHDVNSIFWNNGDTDKYYVNGMAMTEIPSMGYNSNSYPLKFTQTEPSGYIEPIIFTIGNDFDAISDLMLVIKSTNAIPNTASANNMTGLMYDILATNSPFGNTSMFIQRIELCIGNQAIATIPSTQILCNDQITTMITPPTPGSAFPITYRTSDTVIPLFPLLSNEYMNTRDSINQSFLLACASNQTVQLKVYFQQFESLLPTYAPLALTSPSLHSNYELNLEVSLFANYYTMTNAERDFLRNKILPKSFNTSQYSNFFTLPPGFANPTDLHALLYSTGPGATIEINCDHFSIDASSLKLLLPTQITKGAYLASNLPDFSIELFLNSTSYSGIIPVSVANNLAGGTSNLLNTNNTPPDSLYTFVIPFSNMSRQRDSTPARNDLVPLSRYDSIRVRLSFPGGQDALGATTGTGSTTNPGIDANTITLFKNMIVVAEGCCTALYQRGAVTFNNF